MLAKTSRMATRVSSLPAAANATAYTAPTAVVSVGSVFCEAIVGAGRERKSLRDVARSACSAAWAEGYKQALCQRLLT